LDWSVSLLAPRGLIALESDRDASCRGSSFPVAAFI
jgi:hypothetical protein